MKKKVSVLIAGMFVIFMFGFAPGFTDQKPWPVPDQAKNKVNPQKANAESIANGKDLYSTHCKSCHGTKGKGDGPKASQLDTESGDFTKPTFHAQTDGSLFYKLSEGRKDMPAFNKKIKDENDRWDLVNYLRTLK